MLAAIVVGRRFFAQSGIVGQGEWIDDVGIRTAAAASAERPDRSPPGRIGGDLGLQLVVVEAGETHLRVEIVSEAFEGQSGVARQRLVYAALKDEFAAGLHALALTTLTPAEDDKLTMSSRA